MGIPWFLRFSLNSRVALVWLIAVAGAPVVAAQGTPGDVNSDGSIDALDLDLILNHLLNVAPLSGQALIDADANQDGVVDVRDVVFLVRGDHDRDNDGLPDAVEIALGLDPGNPDSDGDGTPDAEEDFDGDGLTNLFEVELGLNPASVDSDGDGFSDSAELDHGTDPLNASSLPAGFVSSPTASYRYLRPPQMTGEMTQLQGTSPPVSYRYLNPAQSTAQITEVHGTSPLVSYRFLNPPLSTGTITDVLGVSPIVSYRYLEAP